VAEGFPASRIEVAYNGIDPGAPPVAADRERARREVGLAPDLFVVGTVARLDPVKDLATLIEAFAALRRGLPGAVLLIVGDGPEREHLEELARARNLSGSVLFSGHRSDARELLPALDLYANSSLTEGVSLTIVEAMAASLPVVATRVGGNPEVVLEDRSGALVAPRDAGALARALQALADDAERRRIWGVAGRRVVEERFSFERMLELYVGAYLGRS
jgi:glycosyltransferase involved in cell wall biosynthesis